MLPRRLSEVHDGKLGWELVVPVFTMTLLLVSSNLVDILFLSRVSPEAVKAVGSLFPIIAVMVLVIRQLSQACGTLMSQHRGRGTIDQLPYIFSSSLFVILCFGFIASLMFSFIKGNVGALFGLDYLTSTLMSQYLGVMSFSIPVQAVTVLLIAVNAAHGNSMVNLAVILLGNGINVLLNYAFYSEWIFSVSFSVYSVAMSTLLSNVFVCCLLLYFVVFRKRIRPHCSLSSLFKLSLIGQVLSIGGPAALFPVAMQLNLLLITYWAANMGTDVLEAQIYTVNCLVIVIAWSSSVAMSAQIRLAYWVGMKRVDLAEHCFKEAIKIAVLGSVFGVFLLWISSPAIFGMLTSNQNVESIGTPILAVCIFLEFFRSMNLVALASLNATGGAKRPVVGSILFMWFIGVPLCWLVGVYGGIGLVGIYVGRVLDEMIRSFYMLRQWKKGDWKKGCL